MSAKVLDAARNGQEVLEADERNTEVILKLRAKLFRMDEAASEWKVLGTGVVKLLKNKDSKKIHLAMRRDETLQICATHAITPDVKLQPSVGSDRSWVYAAMVDSVKMDLAIRFANRESAHQFKATFEQAASSNAGFATEPAASVEAVPQTTGPGPVTPTAEPADAREWATTSTSWARDEPPPYEKIATSSGQGMGSKWRW